MFFGAKKTETIKVDNTSVKDLELVTKMSQEFAKTLDLKETLQKHTHTFISFPSHKSLRVVRRTHFCLLA